MSTTGQATASGKRGGGCQRGNTWPLDDRPIWERPVHKKHDNSKQQGRFKQGGVTGLWTGKQNGSGEATKQTVPKGTQCGPNGPKVITSFCHCELSSVPLWPPSSHRKDWVRFHHHFPVGLHCLNQPHLVKKAACILSYI